MRLPHVRVLKALADAGEPLTLSLLTAKAGYNEGSGTASRALYGVPEESRSGMLQTAQTGLLALGYVHDQQIEGGGRDVKHFSITALGKKVLIEALATSSGELQPPDDDLELNHALWLPDDEADQLGSNEIVNYVPQEGDCRKVVERQIRERRGQQQFRDALRERYGDRCLITGCEVLAILEAAHISPYRGERDNHPANGLLLRADVHTLFDLDLLGIDPDQLRVELHPDVLKEYDPISGVMLGCVGDRQPSTDALKLRYKRFRQRLEDSA